MRTMTEIESPSSDLGVPTAVERDIQPTRRGNPPRSFPALSPRSRLWPALTLAAVLVGCALRLLRWVDDPGLWLDEAYLSINLIDKSLSDIFGTLQLHQSAPPGFLASRKDRGGDFGDGEWALRLPPLVASLASVVLFALRRNRPHLPSCGRARRRALRNLEPLLPVGRGQALQHGCGHGDVGARTDTSGPSTRLANGSFDAWRRPCSPRGRSGFRSPRCSRSPRSSRRSSSMVWRLVPARVRRDAVVAGTGARELRAVYLLASSNLESCELVLFGEGSGHLAKGIKTVENAWWLFVNPGASGTRRTRSRHSSRFSGCSRSSGRSTFELLLDPRWPASLAAWRTKSTGIHSEAASRCSSSPPFS